MLNRPTFRIIPPALILALLSILAIYKADAQDPPRPPETKQTPQQKDARDKNGERRQPDEHTADKDAIIKVDTDMVLLDVTVIDQNNIPVMNLKKEDFSVYEDKVKQTIESVSREEVPV